VDRYGEVHSLLICTSSPLGFLPATRLASRKILIEQNIKKQTGPALWLLCGPYNTVPGSASTWGGGEWSYRDFSDSAFNTVIDLVFPLLAAHLEAIKIDASPLLHYLYTCLLAAATTPHMQPMSGDLIMHVYS
jgi:hypothetical protein